MRIVFMGTPDFSLPTLRSLLDGGHEICCIYTQAPRGSGRGYKKKKSIIHEYGLDKGILVRTPNDFKNQEENTFFRSLLADVCVVVAYGKILPKSIIDNPKYGCINIHASLLPRWRGAAPINRAIQAGDLKSGVTIMQMSTGLDDGDILISKDVEISIKTNAGILHNQLSILGAELILDVLKKISEGNLRPIRQDSSLSTYAKKITKEETSINWMNSAENIDRHVRAFSPYPGAWSLINGKRIKVISGEVCNDEGIPKTIIDDKFTVACGVGAYRINEMQIEGKKMMTSSSFIKGNIMPIGFKLG